MSESTEFCGDEENFGEISYESDGTVQFKDGLILNVNDFFVGKTLEACSEEMRTIIKTHICKNDLRMMTFYNAANNTFKCVTCNEDFAYKTRFRHCIIQKHRNNFQRRKQLAELMNTCQRINSQPLSSHPPPSPDPNLALISSINSSNSAPNSVTQLVANNDLNDVSASNTHVKRLRICDEVDEAILRTTSCAKLKKKKLYAKKDEKTFYEDQLQKLNVPATTFVPMIGDGNCFFRAMAYWIYENDLLYEEVKLRLLTLLTLEVKSQWEDWFGSENFPTFIALCNTFTEFEERWKEKVLGYLSNEGAYCEDAFMMILLSGLIWPNHTWSLLSPEAVEKSKDLAPSGVNFTLVTSYNPLVEEHVRSMYHEHKVNDCTCATENVHFLINTKNGEHFDVCE